MKANSLLKKPVDIENIYKAITSQNECGCFKHFIPHNVYVSESVKLELINNGFKVYMGAWDGVINNCLIIEW